MKFDPFDIADFVPASTCCVGSALIGAAGSLASGLIGSSAAKNASNAQVASQQAAMSLQKHFFDESETQLLPYINAGKGTIPALQGWIDPTQSTSPLQTLLKLTTPGANMNDTLSQTPGFQFTQQYGMKGINNALAARGLAGPGGALARAGADYSAGLAGNTWQSVVNSLLATYQAGATPLQNLVNTGAGSAASLTGAATQTGAQMSQSAVGIGNAQAAGTLGAAGAIGGTVNSLGQYGMLANLLRNNGGGGSGGIYATPADAGFGNGVGSGGYNFLDAAA